MLSLKQSLMFQQERIIFKVGFIYNFIAFSSGHVWMWEWTIKKAERRRINAFELWCCRRLLRVPWSARRTNKSILKEIVLSVHWKDWYWSWNSNTLATWCEELTHFKRPWCWKRLRAGGEGDDRGWDDWMASPTQWTWVCGLHELVMDRESWQAAVHGLTKIWTQLSDWTELRMLNIVSDFFPFFFFLLVFFGLVFDGQYFCFSLEDIPLWM